MTEEILAQPAYQSIEQRELRKCRGCRGCGTITQVVEYSYASGELVEESMTCPICEGAGAVSVFLYAKPRRRS